MHYTKKVGSFTVISATSAIDPDCCHGQSNQRANFKKLEDRLPPNNRSDFDAYDDTDKRPAWIIIVVTAFRSIRQTDKDSGTLEPAYYLNSFRRMNTSTRSVLYHEIGHISPWFFHCSLRSSRRRTSEAVLPVCEAVRREVHPRKDKLYSG